MTNEELAKQLAEMVKEYVTDAIAPIKDQINAINETIKAIPPIEGLKGEVETLAKMIEELPMPKDGADGAPGKDGTDGKDGKDGVDGKDGAPGQDGKNGEDGKDALALEILPAIDEEKCYPRGVYATHKGGLWRSHEKTKGMRGWECIVAGIQDLHIDYDGERKCTVSIVHSSGPEITKEMVLPIVIDRGVFVPEKKYALNDGVTYAGSYWLAVKDEPQGTPGSSDDFRLAVKKGRDYKQPVKVQ